MAKSKGLKHAEVRDCLLREGSSELREEYARLRARVAMMRDRDQAMCCGESAAPIGQERSNP